VIRLPINNNLVKKSKKVLQVLLNLFIFAKR
jgi:hypothetical protein